MGDISEMRGLIYKIDCLPNGRFYIGSTSNLLLRKRQHFHLLRKGRHHSLHLQRAFDKHGEKSFLVSIVEDDIEPAHLTEREGQLIRQLKPAFNGSHVNATRLGATQSLACRLKVSVANKGRRQTEEAKAAIARAGLGNKRAVGNKGPLKVTPDILVTIQTLRSSGLGCRRIARATGLDKGTILNVFNRKYIYAR